MSTTLATKTDLLRIRQEIENKFALLSRDIEKLRLSMTVRLGSMIVGRGRREFLPPSGCGCEQPVGFCRKTLRFR